MTSQSAPVNGFRLAYDREGGGLPAVLLHGWPGHRGDYRDQLAGVGHCVPLEAPQAVAEATVRALRR